MKQALITGACGGIGREVAQRLDRSGYRLILIDINESALLEMAEDYTGSVTVACDLANADRLKKLCSQIENELGEIDIAFVNAGVIAPGYFTGLSKESIDQQIDINFRSAVHLIHSSALNMQQRGKGHIIATVSIGGILSLKGSATYSATKFALRGLLAALKHELADKGIAVSGLYPSGVDTAMLRHEALHGGSALNFIGKVQAVEQVGDAFEKALAKKRLEVYVPYGDSISARLLASFPWVMKHLYPSLEWLGEKGRKVYIKSIDG